MSAPALGAAEKKRDRQRHLTPRWLGCQASRVSLPQLCGLGPGSLPPLPSLEEDFITWREQFWPAVCEHFGVEATGEESR